MHRLATPFAFQKSFKARIPLSGRVNERPPHPLPAPVTHDAPQGKYWVLLESDWDGSECLLSHQDGDEQARGRRNIAKSLTSSPHRMFASVLEASDGSVLRVAALRWSATLT